MNITETMKAAMNVDNCDVLNENGKLRLIYALDGFPTPLILAQANSYHELNEKALRIFDAKKWMRFLIDESAGVSTSAFHPLVADMYKNHHEIYINVTSDILLNKVNGDNVDCQDEEDETPKNCVEVLETGERDERGHRMGRLDFKDLKKMDYGCLKLLAKDLDVSEYDTLGPNDLAYSVSLVDIDVDDADCDYNCEGCDCAEMTDDGDCICHYDDDEDDTDECDGDCDNCEFAELDDRDENDDDSCACEENEHPDWPRPIKDDTNAQPEAPQYEYVNGPAHYHGTECIENMRKLFGDEAVRWFCICNAYKYRFRDGSKPGVTAEQDEKKARWYEDYAVKMMNEQRYY